jgi:hypothetical protein
VTERPDSSLVYSARLKHLLVWFIVMDLTRFTSFLTVLTLKELPIEILPVEFLWYLHEREQIEFELDMLFSWGKARRLHHWLTKPYLKAELMYSLKVILSVIEEVNNGLLSKKDAKKKFGNVKYACGTGGNYIFAVGVLHGLIVPREFLLIPVISTSLCKSVWDIIFEWNKQMTKSQI